MTNIIRLEQFLKLADEITMHQKISSAIIQLPNANVGKPYQFAFNLEQFGLTTIHYFELAGLTELGLNYDTEQQIITGHPTQAGEFLIKFRYKFSDKNDERPLLEKDIALIINPDPKSLWKPIPSDESIKYWKPDSDKHCLSINDNKTIIAASQRGRSHAQEGKCRDDDFAIYYDQENHWTIIAVADGAGSANYARQGSLLACEAIIEYFKTLTNQQIQALDSAITDYQVNTEQYTQSLNQLLYDHLAGAAFKAYKIIEQEAIKNEVKTKDYATTLVFSVLKKFDFGWFIASYGVGDSPMAIYTVDKEAIIMHSPEEGDYSGQTYFLTMPEIFNTVRLNYKIVTDFTAIILMTDGIYDAKFQTKTNLTKTEIWAEFWQDLTTVLINKDTLAEDLLNWSDFWSAGNHDDRTIVILL